MAVVITTTHMRAAAIDNGRLGNDNADTRGRRCGAQHSAATSVAARVRTVTTEPGNDARKRASSAGERAVNRANKIHYPRGDANVSSGAARIIQWGTMTVFGGIGVPGSTPPPEMPLYEFFISGAYELLCKAVYIKIKKKNSYMCIIS